MVATIDETIPPGKMDIGMKEPNCLGLMRSTAKPYKPGR